MDDGRTSDTSDTRDTRENETWRAPMPSLAHRVRMVIAVEVVPLALAVWGVWSVGVSTLGVALFVAMYVLTMTGIELGMHRLVAHRQFTGPGWLRATLCALGAMAGEGSPLLWSAIHRLHHRDPDGADDVHSPTHARTGLIARLRGFVWSQCGWYGEVPGITRFRRVLGGRREASVADTQAQRLVDVVQDWRADRVVLAVDLLYPVWIVAGFVVPTVMGLMIGGGLDGALTGLVWGGVVRFVAVQKVSFAINSVGHTIGSRYLKTGDDSRNNVVMAVLTLGSGWHNNHHAFPGSASLWFAPWHVDPCWLIIRGLERLGVARDVRRVGPQLVEARRAR